MIFARIEEGIIVERISCAVVPQGSGWEQETKGTSRIGERREVWDEDWNERRLSDLVAKGLADIPEGFKLNDAGTEFVEMTEAEKITAGILKPTEREKIADGKIVPKTQAELLKDGLVSAKDYNAYITVVRQAAFASETDSILWDYLEGRGSATKEEWIATKERIRTQYPKVAE